MHLSTLCESNIICTDLPLMVYSGGSHAGDAWRRTGHCGLGRAVNALGLRAHTPINVDFVVCIISPLSFCTQANDQRHPLLAP